MISVVTPCSSPLTTILEIFLYKYHFSDYSVTKQNDQIESRKSNLLHGAVL